MSFDNALARYGRRVVGMGATLAGTLLLACSDGAEGSDVDSITSGVLGGAPSPSERDAVVLVRTDADREVVFCTGTLLSPKVMVTAKHCVFSTSPGGFKCRGNGDLVQLGGRAGEFGPPLAPELVSVFVGSAPGEVPAARGAKIFGTAAEHNCRDDLALVVLDRPVRARYAPIRRSTPVKVGEMVTVAGYGIDPTETTRVRREVDSIRVVDVGSENVRPELATTPTRSFVLPGGHLCQGDSGGPALSRETGALLGTYSRINGDCLDPLTRNTFVTVSKFTELFEAAFREAGELPVEEGQADRSQAAASDAEAAAPLGGEAGGRDAGLESRPEPPDAGPRFDAANVPVDPAPQAAGCRASPFAVTSSTAWILGLVGALVGRRLLSPRVHASKRMARRPWLGGGAPRG